MHRELCLFLVLLSHLPIQSRIEAKASFSIDLIHLDSPLSPFHNHSLTPSEILRKAALRSKTRIEYFKSVFVAQKSVVESRIHPSPPIGAEYLMKIYIGTPPVSFFAIADTGSDLIWVDCTTCKQCFNPKGSSTYHHVFCMSQSCHDLPGHCSGKSNSCSYKYSYGTSTTSSGFTIGILSNDTISLDSTNGRVAFPASIFGCGYYNKFNVFGGSGLVGLGGGPLSLVSQLAPQIDYKFSYCLVPYSPKSTTSSKLKFGRDITMSVASGFVSTPFITRSVPTFYFLTLLGISIGEMSIMTPQLEGNIIIDSGTTFTYLNSSLYGEVEAIVKKDIGVKPVQDLSGTFSLCYKVKEVATIKFPDMIFHFSGADLCLKPINTFITDGNIVCMTIIPTDDGSPNIFGNKAQVNFQVEYDLLRKQISFAPKDCTKK